MKYTAEMYCAICKTENQRDNMFRVLTTLCQVKIIAIKRKDQYNNKDNKTSKSKIYPALGVKTILKFLLTHLGLMSVIVRLLLKSKSKLCFATTDIPTFAGLTC